MTWLEFIIDNFKPGRVKDISRHIEEKAKEKNFNPNNKNIPAKVQQILPEHTSGVFKKTSNRKLKEIFFIKRTDGTYDLIDNIVNPIGSDEFNEEFCLRKTINHENIIASSDITFKRKSNLSGKHKEMVNIMVDYAIYNDISCNKEIRNVDFLMEIDRKLNLYEVKSSKKEIFKAIGQMLVYRNRFKNTNVYKDIESTIVGNFDITPEISKVLKEIDVNYKKIDYFKC